MKRLCVALAASWLPILACSSAGPTGSFAAPDGGGAPVDRRCTLTIAPSRGPTQECCPAHGVDACGALLFCAAFDGRTTPTCYPERSRLDGESCTEDRQCQSGACNAAVSKCKSLPGQPCTAEVGCAPAPGGGPSLACDTADTKPRCKETSSALGGLCEHGSGCASARCVGMRCVLGPGAGCTRNADCSTGYCTNGTGGIHLCSGLVDSACANDAHCTEGRCVLGFCTTPRAGGRCAGPGDCPSSAPYCGGGKCGDGAVGEPCAAPGDCAAKPAHCVGGKCSNGGEGSSCASPLDCEPSAPHCGGFPIAPACHAALGKGGERCFSPSDCTAGMTCAPFIAFFTVCDGAKRLGETCQADTDCAQFQAPLGALVCDPTRRVCLAKSGGDCAAPTDCQSGACVEGSRCPSDHKKACVSHCTKSDGTTESCARISTCQ